MQFPPWTIKGIPTEVRSAATSAAARESMTIGAWMERCIRTQVQAERHRDKAPVPIKPPEMVVVGPGVIPPSVLELCDRAADIAQKLTGEKVPPRLRNQIMRVVHQHVRDLETRRRAR